MVFEIKLFVTSKDELGKKQIASLQNVRKPVGARNVKDAGLEGIENVFLSTGLLKVRLLLIERVCYLSLSS